MTRRRYIPLSVRLKVAARQFSETFPSMLGYAIGGRHNRTNLLRSLLRHLFGTAKVELHHRPALVNRPMNRRKTDTVPPANDPEHLVYLLKDEEHRIETYVRGVGAQRSDVSQRRYLKRVARNRGASDSRSKHRPPKRKWPSRPFPKASKIRGRR